MSTQNSTINRDSQAYWNKRAATFTRDATSDYERWLLDLLALEAGEEVMPTKKAARGGGRLVKGAGAGREAPARNWSEVGELRLRRPS